jgi:hypothetical protein
MRIAKSASLYVVYALLSFWTTGIILVEAFRDRNTKGFWETDIVAAVGFFYSLIILYSLISIFVLHDIGYRQRFLAYAKEEIGFTKKLAFVLSSYELWIDVLTVSVLSLIIRPAAYDDFEIGFLSFAEPQWRFPITLGVFVLCVVLLSAVAYMATVNWWSRPKERRREAEKSGSVKRWLGQLLFSAFLYLVTASMLIWVVPVLWSAVLTFWMIIVAFTVFAIIGILAFVSLKYLRALRHRRRLMKKMKKAMRNGYCTLVYAKDVYRSVFRSREGANICLERNGKRYYCKIITPLKKKHIVYFGEDGWVTVERNMVMALHYRSDKYFFDAEEGDKRILVINPGALRIYATDRLHNRELQSGDKVMGYYVYRTDNFINGIEREYL